MTKSPLDETLQILITAEASICELIQDATEARDYASVSQLSALAQRIGLLRGELDLQQEGEDRPTPEAVPTARSDTTPGQMIDLAPRTPLRRQDRSWRCFTRDERDLVMTEPDADGSSLRMSAKRSVVDAVTSYLEDSRGEPSAEELRSGVQLRMGDGVGNEEIDVVITWLKEQGILAESLQGTFFSTESAADVRVAISEIWASLPNDVEERKTENRKKRAREQGTAPAGPDDEQPGAEYDISFKRAKWHCYLCAERPYGADLEHHLQDAHGIPDPHRQGIVRIYHIGATSPRVQFSCPICRRDVQSGFRHLQTHHSDLNRGPSTLEPDDDVLSKPFRFKTHAWKCFCGQKIENSELLVIHLQTRPHECDQNLARAIVRAYESGRASGASLPCPLCGQDVEKIYPHLASVHAPNQGCSSEIADP